MNTITITFTHPEALAPTYKFGARVATVDDCQPEAWALGKIVGLHLEEFKYSPSIWMYIVKLDSPLGYTKEYSASDLLSEDELPTLQAEWDERVAAWTIETEDAAI